MITANQLRAARALLNIDQRQTAELADLSVPTIQRMEASDGVIRGNVDSLMKLVSALENAGIELINPGLPSSAGGRGVRLRDHVTKPKMKNIKQHKPSSPRTRERARLLRLKPVSISLPEWHHDPILVRLIRSPGPSLPRLPQ